MQLRAERSQIDLDSLTKLVRAYIEEEEGISSEHATALAERFLVVAHERSGLLVETEPTDPPVYAFTHEGFREYLVADALFNSGETRLIRTVLDNIDNPTWEEVILLTGSHSGLSHYLRERLLNECLETARVCKAAGNLDGWARRLTMTGRMARDMGENLFPKDRTRVQDVLLSAMLSTSNPIKYRIELCWSSTNSAG